MTLTWVICWAPDKGLGGWSNRTQKLLPHSARSCYFSRLGRNGTLEHSIGSPTISAHSATARGTWPRHACSWRPCGTSSFPCRRGTFLHPTWMNSPATWASTGIANETCEPRVSVYLATTWPVRPSSRPTRSTGQSMGLNLPQSTQLPQLSRVDWK